ncbi:protein activator [Pseudomonas sp. PE-S1G-1]|uniref:protein activator n=1 Tax=Pseudomonas sp. PE-S1G-1 TaxID=1986995 RepID=UPI00117B7917|nr:protein activator [Pseudomonas sp. PE-S1G-1]
MQSLTTRISLTALLLGLAFTSSMTHAASFAQAGAVFTATGSISTAVKLLVWTPVPCTVALTGKVASDGSSATITGATFTGNALCGVSGPLNLPWTLVPTTASTATLSGFAEKFFSDTCASPSTLTTQWSAADNTFSLLSPHTVSDSCRITAFSFKPSPVLTISP